MIIDAGGDASRSRERGARSRSRRPPAAPSSSPGNFNFLVETAVFGTEPKFAAKGVKPDLDGDGKVEFGEALPDADFLVAAARDFEDSARSSTRPPASGARRRRTPSPRSS